MSRIDTQLIVIQRMGILLNKYGENELSAQFLRFAIKVEQIRDNKIARKEIKKFAEGLSTGYGGIQDMHFERSGKVFTKDTNEFYNGIRYLYNSTRWYYLGK